MSSRVCTYCNSTNVTCLDSYKFVWHVCGNCGCAKSDKKDCYLLDFAKYPLEKYLQKKGWKQTIHRILHNESVEKDNSKIYDYFISDGHITFCLKDAEDFEKSVINAYGIELQNKSILDISGGNGHFLNYYKEKYNCDVTLTEFNQKALSYASETLGLKTQYYDFSKHYVTDFFEEKQFDCIFVRAAVMFMDNISEVFKNFSKVLKDDGVLIVNYSVIPTFGTIFRTQYDEYNYLNLYSTKFMEEHFKNNGFDIISKQRNYDYSTYVTDLDCYPIERILSRYYELKALKHKSFYGEEILSRDRRRYDFVVKKSSSKRSATFDTKNFINEVGSKEVLNQSELEVLERLCKKIDVVGELFCEYQSDLSSKYGLTVLTWYDKLKLVEILEQCAQANKDWKFYNSALKLLEQIPEKISSRKRLEVEKRVQSL